MKERSPGRPFGAGYVRMPPSAVLGRGHARGEHSPGGTMTGIAAACSGGGAERQAISSPPVATTRPMHLPQRFVTTGSPELRTVAQPALATHRTLRQASRYAAFCRMSSALDAVREVTAISFSADHSADARLAAMRETTRFSAASHCGSRETCGPDLSSGSRLAPVVGVRAPDERLRIVSENQCHHSAMEKRNSTGTGGSRRGEMV